MDIQLIKEKAKKILLQNSQQIIFDNKQYHFTAPTVIKEEDSHLDYINKQWFWDSCLIAMALTKIDLKKAKEEIYSILKFASDNGFIPHMNYWKKDAQLVPEWAAKQEKLDTYWDNEYSSNIIQPPILAIAIKEVYKNDKDKEFIKNTIKPLINYYDYLHNYRNLNNDYLISIIHPWESGWDNSPRWDLALNLQEDNHYPRKLLDKYKLKLFKKAKKLNWDAKEIIKNQIFDVKPLDFNILYAYNVKALSFLLKELNEKELSLKFKERYEKIKESIINKMKNKDFYSDLIGKQYIKSNIKSAAMFLLFLLEDNRIDYEKLINNYLLNEKEFYTPFIVPTISRSHKSFYPSEYWRGNIWININYFIYKGLKKLDSKLAQLSANKIKESTLSLLYNFDFYEYFNPINGKGYGVKNFSWNSIILLMDI